MTPHSRRDLLRIYTALKTGFDSMLSPEQLDLFSKFSGVKITDFSSIGDITNGIQQMMVFADRNNVEPWIV